MNEEKEPERPKASSGPESEFEDEEPGSYLAELGTRPWSIAWGISNIALVLAIGLPAAIIGLSPASEWHPLARLIWAILPISSMLLIIVTLWQAASGYVRASPRRALWALALAIIGLGAWLLLRYEAGVLPGS